MKEYGGYLPLELPRGEECYANIPDMDLMRLNCGRSAIYCALLSASPQKVYIPYYNCDTVKEPLERLGIRYEYYRLNRDYMPDGIGLGEGEYLLWVDYFGVSPRSRVAEIRSQYKRVIYDNTQAFFAPPVKGAYNVYSCRKFFGVSDGAYLIADHIDAGNLERDVSTDAVHHIVHAYEAGTNGAYAGHLANEAAIFKRPKLMSAFTRRVLSSIDYAGVKRRRIENYMALADLLGPVNRFEAPQITGQVPMVYPFLVEDIGLRKRLIENRVYVPNWWKCVLELVPEGSLEHRLSQYLLPLPVDQRYDSGDMRLLADLVRRCLNKNSEV